MRKERKMNELIKLIEIAIHNHKALGFPAMYPSEYNVFRFKKDKLDDMDTHFGYLYEACYLRGLYDLAEDLYKSMFKEE